MILPISITSIESTDLHPYRTLRQPVEHFLSGVFIAEGEKVVRRLVESHLQILSVLITPEWLTQYRSVLDARMETIRVYVAPKDLLETIVGFHLHQGIMALGKIPAPTQLEHVVRNSDRPYLFVALDGLTNSENIGVVVRNCVAFGVEGILVGETSSSPYLRRAVRNSMGAVFNIPVVHCTNLSKTLTELRIRFSTKVLAVHPHAEKNVTQKIDYSTDLCLVLGSEGEGISENILTICNDAIAIPMRPGVDSLNVASASAVFLYEVMQQRAGTFRKEAGENQNLR